MRHFNNSDLTFIDVNVKKGFIIYFYFRLDSSYVPVGKCGIAIIGSETVKSYDLILYKTKQDILSRSNLRSDCTFTIQANNYVSFCDDQKIQWTVHFDGTKVLEEFTEQIKVCNGTVIPISTTPTNICDKDSSSKTKKSVPIDSPPVPKDSDSSDNSYTQTRANILSRMAKMGQSILPINLPKASEQSDSETDEQTVSKKPVKKRQKPVLVNGEYFPSDKVKQVNITQASNLQTPEFLMLNGQIVPVSSLQQCLSTQIQQPIPNQYNIPGLPNQVVLNPQVSPLSDSLHVFIAENRTHNCELRMNMTQLSSKLDNILSKLNNHSASDEIINKNELELQMLEKTKELESSKEIIHNLQEQSRKLEENVVDNNLIVKNLKQENENQKRLIFEQEQRICEQEKNMLCLENQIAQNRIEQDNTKQMQQTIDDLKRVIEDQKIKLQQSEESQERIKENQNLESTLATLNEDISCLRRQLEDKNSKADNFSRKLKQSMNSLFQQIMEEFADENVTFQSIQIKQIVSQKLKTTTWQIIQDFQNDFKTNNQ